jgi:hypothetical protein
MPLQLKFEFRFDGNLLFDGFLPETKDQGVHMSLADGRYTATLYMPNRRDQLDHVADVPKNEAELEKYTGLRCSGLTLKVEDTQVDGDVLASIHKEEKTAQTENYGIELFEMVARIHTRVVDYFHNVKKQTWIEPLFPELRGYPKKVELTKDNSSAQMFLNKWDACWLDSNGQWRRLVVGEQRSRMKVYIRKGVNQESWLQLGKFVEQNKRAPILHVVIANSLQHLNEKNDRLAVIEAVIALESAIRQLLAKVIVRLPGVPPIDEKELDRLIEKAGLRLSTQVFFRLIQTRAELSEDDVSLVIEAIEVRNSIIHNSTLKIDSQKTWKYVNAIRRICERLESWLIDEAKAKDSC